MQMTPKLHCASCGRPNKHGPDGADPFLYEGQLWCSWCARISQTNTGSKYVVPPSPGLMVEDPENDPLTAWQDCYSMEPKKRILMKDAKSEIQRAWGMWEGDKRAKDSMFVFLRWLTRYRPYFLTFRSKVDPWKKVRSWLLQYENDQQDFNGPQVAPKAGVCKMSAPSTAFPSELFWLLW